MNITKIQATALFTALGFKTAAKWTEARFNSRLKALPANTEGVEVEDVELNALLTAIRDSEEACTLGEETTIPAAKKSAAKKSKKSAAKTEDAPAKKKSAAKKAAPKFEKDALGNRVGSQAAAINAALSKKAQTVEQIAEKSGLGAPRCGAHMKYLEQKALVKKSDKGWALA